MNIKKNIFILNLKYENYQMFVYIYVHILDYYLNFSRLVIIISWIQPWKKKYVVQVVLSCLYYQMVKFHQ